MGNKFGILTVGDSFKFGHGVNGHVAYLAVLQGPLRAHMESMEIEATMRASGPDIAQTRTICISTISV